MNRCRLRASVTVVVLSVALSSSLGCSDKGGADTPPATGSAEAAPGSDAPAQGVAISAAEPAMLSKVGEVGLPPAEAPSSWSAGWQLTPGTPVRYSYLQQITAEMAGQAASPSKQGMEVSGTLVVTPTSATAADIELTDARSVVTAQIEGQPEQRMEQPLPPKKYGALLSTTNAPVQPEDPLLFAILAVPQEPSAVGEKISKQLTMPIDGPEGELTAAGTATWTLRGFVQCGEHTCAHYSHDVDIAKLSLPPGAKGSYGARARAIGWTLVDVDDHALYRHKSATHLRLQAEVPATSAAGSHGAASQPAKPQSMDMAQEHFHELVRQAPAAQEAAPK